MPGPTRFDKRGRPKRKRPKVIKGDGSVRPYRGRPSAGSGGRTRTEVGTQKSLVEALGYSPRVSGSNRRLASSLPVPRVSSRPVVDPALVPNAVTGLSPGKQRRAVKAISGSEGGEGPKAIARAAADIGLAVVPGGALVRGTGAGVKVARALRSAEKAAEGAQKVSRAARAADKASDAKKAARVARAGARRARAFGEKPRRVRKADRRADRAERRSSRARVRAERARMSRGERAKDRARDVKTRAQAGAQGAATKVLLGSGAAGLGAREIARKSPTKRAAAAGLAREAGKVPGRAGKAAVRQSVAPGLAPVGATVPANETAANVAQLPFQLGRATVESPGAVVKGSLISGRDMLLGAPAAVYQVATDPKQAANDMAADYSRRYGPLVSGDMKEFRRRVKYEGGLTPFGLDALGAAGGTGAVAGRAARAGALGKRAERFMTRDRKGVLVRASDGPKKRRMSKNMGVAATQRAADAYRGRVTRKRSERGDALAREAVRQGAVVPVRQKYAVAKDVAGRKARTRLTNLTQIGRVTRRARALVSSMSRDQQASVHPALALGLRTPAHARAEIPKRIEQIRANRAPDTRYGKLDNIPGLERTLARADEIFTPEFGRKIDQLIEDEKRLVPDDPALTEAQALNRREAQQAEHLIGRRAEGESMDAYRARYQEALSESGLAPGGYFPSELSRRRMPSAFATGGSRHSHRTKPYSGKLFREGIENPDPEVLVQHMAVNVKRKNSWPMVSEVFEQHSLPWSRGKDGQGVSQSEIIRHIEAEGIDPASVSLVNPGLMRRQATQGLVEATERSGSGVRAKRSGLGNDELLDLGDAIKSATARQSGPEFEQMKGWYAVPNAVLDELESSMKDGKIARSMDLAMSKMSGYLLAGNTGWLGFQTLSTAVQAMLAGVTPADWLRAQLFWARLNRENAPTGKRTGVTRRRAPENADQLMGNPDLDRLNAYAGISTAQEFRQPPHMGSQVPGPQMIQGAVEGYRVFRDGKWGQAMRSANPIQAWFRLSQIPEAANRRAVAYKLLRSEATKRMNQNVKKMDAAINRMTNIMKLDPEGQIRELIRNPKVLDDMAEGLADFLGDFQTFTGLERRVFKRMIPFYSWMRFATKFALFTLPSKHPAATALTYQLGRLQTDELRDVLGDGMGWALGKMFMGDPNNVATRFIDIYRGNPVLSALVEFQDEKDLMSFVPPWVAILANPIWGKDYFTGKDVTVDGETMGRKWTGIGAENLVQLWMNGFARLFTPYRVAEEIRYQGTPQSTDASLWSPQPKRYSPNSTSDAKERGEREYREGGGAMGVLYRRGLPFLPQDSARLREQAKYANAEAAKERQRISGRGSSSGDPFDDAFSQAFDDAFSGGDAMGDAFDDAFDDAFKRAGLK